MDISEDLLPTILEVRAQLFHDFVGDSPSGFGFLARDDTACRLERQPSCYLFQPDSVLFKDFTFGRK
jgi:hypothetical protein